MIKVLYICMWLMWPYNPQTSASSEPLPHTFPSERHINLNKMQKEQWKQIVGYEDKYLISTRGRVLSLPSEQPNPQNHKKKILRKLKLLSVLKSKSGYSVIGLCDSGSSKMYYVHRLIGLAFIPNPNNKPHINHKDGDKQNNNIENLEWVTPSENHIHAFKIGLRTAPMIGKFGTNHHRSKPVYQIMDGKIIAEYGSQGEAQRETGICRSNITSACSGRIRFAGGYQWRLK